VSISLRLARLVHSSFGFATMSSPRSAENEVVTTMLDGRQYKKSPASPQLHRKIAHIFGPDQSQLFLDGCHHMDVTQSLAYDPLISTH